MAPAVKKFYKRLSNKLLIEKPTLKKYLKRIKINERNISNPLSSRIFAHLETQQFSIKTLSRIHLIVTLSIMTLSMSIKNCYAECRISLLIC